MKDWMDFVIGVIMGASGVILFTVYVLVKILLNIPDEHNPD